MRVENERGEFFLVENDVPPRDAATATCRCRRFHAVAPDTRRRADRRAGARARSTCGAAVFLDTETTGLAGGTGTAAFLVGVGFVDGDRFRVRQYFMRDYHEEAALLHALAEDLARFDRLVTFNGKMFDVPLLEARYRLNRARFPLAAAPHLDLLHPARRLWKARLESCRLQSLEAELLGVRAPRRRRPARRSRASTSTTCAAATRAPWRASSSTTGWTSSRWPRSRSLACQWVEEARAEDPRDVFSLARVLERARLYERCEAEYRRALAAGAGAAARGRRCCAWPRAPSARATTTRAAELWAAGGARRATGGLCASWRSTTSTAAATSQRRSRAVERGSLGRARGARPARLAPGRGARRRLRRRAAQRLHARVATRRYELAASIFASRQELDAGPGSATGFLKTADAATSRRPRSAASAL